jgi:hypothetical protein
MGSLATIKWKIVREAKAENGKSLGAWSAEDLKLEIWNLRGLVYPDISRRRREALWDGHRRQLASNTS